MSGPADLNLITCLLKYLRAACGYYVVTMLHGGGGGQGCGAAVPRVPGASNLAPLNCSTVREHQARDAVYNVILVFCSEGRRSKIQAVKIGCVKGELPSGTFGPM